MIISTDNITSRFITLTIILSPFICTAQYLDPHRDYLKRIFVLFDSYMQQTFIL